MTCILCWDAVSSACRLDSAEFMRLDDVNNASQHLRQDVMVWALSSIPPQKLPEAMFNMLSIFQQPWTVGLGVWGNAMLTCASLLPCRPVDTTLD